jgi:hypothetical protein
LCDEGDEEAENIRDIVWDNEEADSRAGAALTDFVIVSKKGSLILDYL